MPPLPSPSPNVISPNDQLQRDLCLIGCLYSRDDDDECDDVIGYECDGCEGVDVVVWLGMSVRVLSMCVIGYECA